VDGVGDGEVRIVKILRRDFGLSSSEVESSSWFDRSPSSARGESRNLEYPESVGQGFKGGVIRNMDFG